MRVSRLNQQGDAMLYFWVMLGGGARYAVSGLAASHIGPIFPWGTLIVNVTGSFVIGFFATLTGPDGRVFVGTEGRQFVMTGVCGGYTTFSSFSLQTLNLVRDGEMTWAAANIGLSLLLCLMSVWAGHAAASALNQLKGG
jgi:CrcB protein